MNCQDLRSQIRKDDHDAHLVLPIDDVDVEVHLRCMSKMSPMTPVAVDVAPAPAPWRTSGESLYTKLSTDTMLSDP